MSLIWSDALTRIRSRVTRENYNTYFRPLRLATETANHLVLEVDDAFFGDWIREHYFDLLTQAITDASGRAFTVELKVADTPASKLATEPLATKVEKTDAPTTGSPIYERAAEFPLNPQYTFDNFVVGPANQMAHAAARSVAESPSQVFNPLFLYGGTGLGKTHLLHAIAHRIKQSNPLARIVYISAEEFMNQVIRSIKNRTMEALRERYRRECDVLLMDDIHVLAGKEATQEEFFHTFNALHAAQKQIVLTSDQPPQEISRLEQRLRSRFQWGLIIDIQPPQFETRVAILQEKACRDAIELPDEVSLYLARVIHANVRELEGALTRLSAFASFRRCSLSLEFAMEIFRGFVEEKRNVLTVERVLSIVSEHFDVSVPDLLGKRRFRAIAHPRSVAMYLCRKHVQASFPQLGREFGGKDHSTILAACRKVEKALDSDKQLSSDIKSIEKKIGA
ncbi:MAG: chromosomal replication initiator protein DnaA [Bradymonadia bacterium]